jgi:hypothetical protein
MNWRSFICFLLNLVCKVCIPNARCALTESRDDSEREVQREQRKLENPGARSAQRLEATKVQRHNTEECQVGIRYFLFKKIPRI